MDQLTILECKPNLWLTKRFSESGVEQYSDAKSFRPRTVDVKDLHDLHIALQRLQHEPHMCVIRGGYRGPNENDFQPRKNELYADTPRHWLMIDADDDESPLNVKNPEADITRWIETYLPEPFHSASYVWQLSPSAGVKPGLRAHIWFWLETPATSAQLREWAKVNELRVDAAVFKQVQPHYTAAPIFLEPLTDPIKTRLGYCDGFDDAVPSLSFEGLSVAREHETEEEFRQANAEKMVRFRLDRMEDYLAMLDPDSSYQDWLEVGMGIHFQTEGSEEGWELFDTWSQRGASYKGEEETRAKWESFGLRNSSNPTSFATVVQMCGGRLKDAQAARLRIAESTSKDEAIKYAAQANVDSIDRAQLCELVRKKIEEVTGEKAPPLGTIKKVIQEHAVKYQARRGEDLQMQFVRFVLDRHFSGGEHLIRFSKTFWLYEEGRWRMTEEEAVRNKVLEAVTFLKEDSEDDYNDLLAMMLDDGNGATKTMVDTIFTNLCTSVARDGFTDPLNLTAQKLPSVMNCLNGEVWFEEDGSYIFQDHDAANMFTHRVNAEFRPHAKCPRWDKAIARIFQEQQDPEEVIRHFYEVMGYLLQFDRGFAYWLLLQGSGSNGKTFVVSVLQELLGNSVLMKDIAELSTRVNNHFEAELVGKLALVDDDFRKGGILPDSWMKKLSEAKLITANPKFGAPFNFTCRATPVILSNGWPATKDVSDGMSRRAMIFHFNSKILPEERDPNLAGYIIEHELPGVLNHFIMGWGRVKARGRFLIPVDCELAKAKWVEQSNTVALFVSECLEVTKNVDDWIPAQDVYAVYKHWAEENGTLRTALGRNKFYEALGDLGHTVRPGHSNQRAIFGVRLNEEATNWAADDF